VRDRPSVAKSGYWVLTDAGRDVLADHERCSCVPVRIGRMVECEACGTVYGAIAFDDHRYAYFDSKRDR